MGYSSREGEMGKGGSQRKDEGQPGAGATSDGELLTKRNVKLSKKPPWKFWGKLATSGPQRGKDPHPEPQRTGST